MKVLAVGAKGAREDRLGGIEGGGQDCLCSVAGVVNQLDPCVAQVGALRALREVGEVLAAFPETLG